MVLRRYGDGCAVAHAMELVGERWALLVVRELLLGPKRYRDLQRGLPRASPNVLSQRLRELEAGGVLRRARLGPPASAWVYELTDWGHELGPVVLQLGRWAAQSPGLDRDADVSPDALAVAVQATFDPSVAGALRARYELCLDADRFVLRVADGALTVTRGDPPPGAPGADAAGGEPSATRVAAVETDAATWAALLRRRTDLQAAQATGRLRLAGDAVAVQRLLDACVPPSARPDAPATPDAARA